MPTAKQTAYLAIKHEILDGQFPPGHLLIEPELAEHCGVSRTPVREALRDLADEGLVQLRANRRAVVPIVTETRFEEVFDIMAMLESYSTGLAATRIEHKTIAEIEDINDRLEYCMNNNRADGYQEFLELNSQFHKKIHAAAENDTLLDVLLRVIDFPTSVCLKFGQINWDGSSNVAQEHRDIITSLKTGDQDLAALNMKKHIETVRRSFRALWENEV
ncbi:MAG: GntR family transcriptional regulator [Rhodospirillaceae bacterium]|jgi:DNA-binding GntR family transcriptional regulator|nr:GntR family transcriptional regulator [Rhodospirillaceae bacterium]MBT5938750.1 GntR family transcriptional regulator [Rhodospirillaceae bacterium]MBT7268398.1 GntR family transcriptional regulator [Rhodospirillaceae bacterium]